MCTERKPLTKECGWKDGDRGGSARTEGTTGRKKKNRLDSHRPSHGRSYATTGLVFLSFPQPTICPIIAFKIGLTLLSRKFIIPSSRTRAPEREARRLKE